MMGSFLSALHSFISLLSRPFAMKDLGDLHYFLDVQVTHSSAGLFLFQYKYTSNLLRKFHMDTCKPVRTPSAARTTLSLSNGELLIDPTECRSMVGALQYLTMTRPDIAYALHVVSQFMHAPRTIHLLAAKRILRYLQGTLDHGILLRSAAVPSLVVAYSDAEWAGCRDSYRSTTGYAVFFGPNLIAWRLKK